MAYNKKEWSLTTPITPEELNRMEQGIEDNDTAITEHINDTNNPHNVTTEQINTYEKQVIDNKVKTVQDDLDNHKNNKNNPHGTTADQVGAYTKEETDNKFVDKITYTQDKQEIEQSIDDIKEQIDEPSFIEMVINEPVYHITEATLDSPKEIQLIEGNTIEVDGQLLPVKNPVIESVGKQIWDEQWEQGSIESDGTLSIDSGRIRSKNYLQVNYEETISSSVPFNFVALYDKDRSFIERLAIGSYTFTNNNANAKYIKFTYLVENVPSDYKIMVNVGSQPLPYEPFRSTKLAINGEYHQWDKIINENGVYYDEVGSGQITLDGSENWAVYPSQHNEVTEYYYVFLPKDIGVKYVTSEYEVLNAIAPGFEATYRFRVWSKETTDEVFTIDERSDTEVTFRIRISKERLSGRTIKEYLSQNPLTVVYQLATPTRKPTSITKAGDPDFSQGNTIYLHSDTEAIPTVHAKVAMDIAGQVNQLTKDSSNKSKKLHDHGQRIKANEIAIEQLETDIQNTFVDTTYTISNGHLTFYRKDGTTKVIDLPLEMIIESGRFDEETKTIILTMANQQTIEIPVGAVVTDISEALHDVEENLNLTQAKVNQLQTDVSQVQENVTNISTSITAIQIALNNKITLNTGYSAIKKEYEKGTILPVSVRNPISIGTYRYIKVRFDNNIPIGFEETDYNDPDRLDGTWVCIGQCGENYYLFQRLS